MERNPAIPDHDPLTFEWSTGGAVLGTSATLAASLPLGTNVVTLKVTDPCGASAQSDVIVRVLDTAPPTISCPAPETAASGNSAATDVSLTVADTTAPAILSMPGAIAVSVGAKCQAAVPNVLPAVTAADNCTPANSLVMSQSRAAGTLLPTGMYVLT